MKKYLVLLMCLLIVGCGKDYKTYTEREKEKLYEIAYNEKMNGNPEKMNYIDDLKKKLEKAASEGDQTALKELEEWRLTGLFYFVPMSDPNYKVNFENRLW